MKTTFCIFLTYLLMSFNLLPAQEIIGRWGGVLKVPNGSLRVIFNISKSEKGFIATMDSPDQGVNGIPVTKTTFENDKICFEISNAQIKYSGDLKGNEVIGVFTQGGHEFPLNLTKKHAEKEIRRPQEPTKPFPYYTEDLIFQNPTANISLSGTLTLPKKEGVFPVVVLISGSGAQNRDEEILGHKPFLVIADYLTKMGIGVLRFDDRGVGESKGDFNTATTADFATDVESAVEYLKTRKEVNKKQIGLAGHSEGGIIAPMVASKSKDVGYIILLAGTGVQGYKVLLKQQELISRANGVSEADIKKSAALNREAFETVIKSTDYKQLKTELTNQFIEILKKDTSVKLPEGMTKDNYVAMQVNQISGNWMQFFLKFNPNSTLKKVTCPVLALNGEKDLQVEPKENLKAIQESLARGGNKKVTIKELPNLNHLFQECKTGSPQEYSSIEQTFSPVALDLMAKWILKIVN